MEMQVPCTDGRFPVSQQTLAEDGTPPRACLMGRFAIAALHGTHSMFLLKSVPGRRTSQTRVVAGRPCTRPQQIFFRGKDGISSVQLLPARATLNVPWFCLLHELCCVFKR